jgi:hypothetical protein
MKFLISTGAPLPLATQQKRQTNSTHVVVLNALRLPKISRVKNLRFVRKITSGHFMIGHNVG